MSSNTRPPALLLVRAKDVLAEISRMEPHDKLSLELISAATSVARWLDAKLSADAAAEMRSRDFDLDIPF
ncbi:hypothetical protein [Bradyrhizobium sp. SZCCHNRI20481]|uniref:hypothetical protein n=1 Tax=Bradyrhizobium sp. SZCCHNRI20481 TaxID=3057286 RepID=UPI0029168DC5|nr:hypothetical protein [Bradyrhizobium sp. SZCCHNRI20481]